MTGTIDDRYFEWLYSHIGSVTIRDPSRTFWSLTRVFYTTEFTWFVPNDDNRIADAREMRIRFVQENGLPRSELSWFQLGCSIFEMLVALSNRMAFQTNGTPAFWFGQMLENLGLERYSDDLWEISIEEEVKETALRLVGRTYEANGTGGLFPLVHPRDDQRAVEIWYQMESYLLERM